MNGVNSLNDDEREVVVEVDLKPEDHSFHSFAVVGEGSSTHCYVTWNLTRDQKRDEIVYLKDLSVNIIEHIAHISKSMRALDFIN